MFCGFNVKLTEEDIDVPCFLKFGQELFEQQRKEVSQSLKNYINDEGVLSATKIEEDWFPRYKANVFISHSHKDEKLVKAFAGWLHEFFGITSFVDSCVWGYSDELLRMIDKKYCVLKRKPDGSIDTYDYSKRNNSTAHVHMILNSALTKMIDSTECLMFINTPNSTLINDVIEGLATASPWIYSELLISRLIEHKKLSEYRMQPILEHAEKYDSLVVHYDVKTDHLIDLPEGTLLEWWQYHKNSNPQESLDALYKMRGLIDAR